MRMQIYLHLHSPNTAKQEQFSLSLINPSLNIYSYIDQPYFLFVRSFPCSFRISYWCTSFLLIFTSSSYILVVGPLSTLLRYKYIFQGCGLPLVVFMAGLRNILVL